MPPRRKQTAAEGRQQAVKKKAAAAKTAASAPSSKDIMAATESPFALKRGSLDARDDHDDPAQDIDDLLSGIDKRKLTKWDKHMLTFIRNYENSILTEDGAPLGAELFETERALAKEGKPLNCLAIVYWRFRKFWELEYQRTAHPSKSVGPTKSAPRAVAESVQEPQQLQSPNKRQATRGVSRGPSRVGLNSSMPPSQSNRPLRNPTKSSAPTRSPRRPPISPSKVMKSNLQKGSSSGSVSRAQNEGTYFRILEKIKDAAYRATVFGDRGQLLTWKAFDAEHNHPYLKDDFNDAVREGIDLAREIAAEEDALHICDQCEQVPDAESVGGDNTPKRGLARTPKTGNSSSAASPRKRGRPLGASGADSGRGNVISSTNPVYIPQDKEKRLPSEKLNPFFEPLPGKETWHRRMLPSLPFGETPYWEDRISRGIAADLNRSHEKPASELPEKTELPKPGAPTLIERVFGSKSARSGAETLSAVPATVEEVAEDDIEDDLDAPLPTPWDLPGVDDRVIAQFIGRAVPNPVAGPSSKGKRRLSREPARTPSAPRPKAKRPKI